MTQRNLYYYNKGNNPKSPKTENIFYVKKAFIKNADLN